MLSRGFHHKTEIVALALDAIKDSIAEGSNRLFMQVFQLTKEQRAEGRMELGNEIGSLRLINSGMIA